MPPKGHGRGRGRAGGRGAKVAGRAGRAQSNKQPNQGKTNPPAKRAKQNSQSVIAATGATEPSRTANAVAAAGARPKGPGATPPAGKADAVSAEATPSAPVAQPANEAKAAVARQAPREASAQHMPPPTTPASVPSGDRASRIDTALKQILSSPSPQHSLPPTTTSSAASAAATDPRQSRPWSRDDYFARVKTFKPSYWFAPPRQLSPMVCARFGWVCDTTDTLACRCCESRITYRAPVSDSDGEWTATIDAFTRRLSDAHTPECPWRKEVCPSGFLEFPPSDGDELFASFILRLRDLIRYQRETSWLPRVQSAARLAPEGQLQELDVDSPSPRNLAALAGFPQTCADTAHAACMLALFGWSIRISNAQHGPSSTGSSSPVGPMAPSGDCNGVLQCDLCGRTCGVWNFSALKSAQSKQQAQQKHKVPEEIERPTKLRRTQAPSAARSGHAGSAHPASNPQTVEMLSSYKHGRHPCLGGVEPQLVGQYAARRHGIQPDPTQSSSLCWQGHFVADALLWATPLQLVGEVRPNKRQQPPQSRHGSGDEAAAASDDLDTNDGEMDSDDETAGRTVDSCFDARVEHRSFCPWVGDGDGSRPLGLHPGWRQTRTVVLMEIKRRQRGDLPFGATAIATAGAGNVATFSAGVDQAVASDGAGGKMAVDTTSVWAALRRSLHGVR